MTRPMRKCGDPRRFVATWAMIVIGDLLGAAGPVLAQGSPGEPLTLRAAAAMALEGYPAIGASEALLGASRSAEKMATAARWPGVQLNASAMRFQEPMLVSPLHGFDPQTVPPFDETLFHGNVTARYTIFDGGERGARIEMARSRAGAAEAALQGTQADVIWQVTRQYALVLAARDAVVAHDQRITALEEELDRAQRLFAVGRAPQLRVLRAQAAVSGGQAERVRSVTMLETAQHDLARLIGAEAGDVTAAELFPVRLVGKDVPSRAALFDRAVASSPEVARMEHESQVARGGVKLARSAFLPDVHLLGLYDNRADTDGNSFGEWSFGGTLSFPLFQGGARRNDLARARSEVSFAEQQLEMALLRAQEGVDRALAALREADARAASLGIAEKQFAEVVRGEKLALETGTGNQVDYLATEAELLSARAQLAQAKMDQITTRAELARVTGQLSLDWLLENLENAR
ncbi:MAG: TolC family protein [Longimicrobiales bacterium]